MSDAQNNEKSALVPRLRFPEFRGAAGWKAAQLDTLISVVTPPKKIPTTEYLAEGQFPIIDQGQSAIAGWTDDPDSLIKEDVPLIIFGDHTCALKLARSSFAQGADGIKILKGNGPTITEFLYQHLCFRPVLPEEYKRHFSILRDKVIAYPEAKGGEQQKIADCLSSLDELITAETQKLDALKTHKKGLMQQVFPREGETVPRLRFPEFREAEEWEKFELGPLATKVGSGITPTGGDRNYKTSGRPFVRSQNIGWGELILGDVAFIDEETHQSFDSTEIKVSDVLLNITGASIGRSAVADSRIAGGNVNQHVCIIRVKRGELNPVLLNQFLISDRGQKQIDSFQAGGNRQGLNFAQIRSFEIPLPPTEDEQRRIAECLSSLDNLIAAQSQKIDSLKTHKKGLMQQLFPVLDEAPA